VGAVGWITVRADWWPLMTLGQGGVDALPGALGRAIGGVWLVVAVAYLALAGADYGYQWWEHERGLRMTRQEVREEARQSEGDPQLRARQKSLHRQVTSRRMLAEVKRADVVLRNPTHYAVALRYDGGRQGAPRVVAKGARLMALRIIELARRHHVPVVENPPLARTLFGAVRVGAEIPPALYRAVAEVLAHVYSLRGAHR
jgi:flagellar biosynthetic protein FlhB